LRLAAGLLRPLKVVRDALRAQLGPESAPQEHCNKHDRNETTGYTGYKAPGLCLVSNGFAFRQTRRMQRRAIRSLLSGQSRSPY
jgi:hypothetical protein